jgi:hypothetical protein
VPLPAASDDEDSSLSSSFVSGTVGNEDLGANLRKSDMTSTQNQVEVMEGATAASVSRSCRSPADSS